jgi:hypothetical protein
MSSRILMFSRAVSLAPTIIYNAQQCVAVHLGGVLDCSTNFTPQTPPWSSSTKNWSLWSTSLGALTTPPFFLEQSARSWNRLAKKTWSGAVPNTLLERKLQWEYYWLIMQFRCKTTLIANITHDNSTSHMCLFFWKKWQETSHMCPVAIEIQINESKV